MRGEARQAALVGDLLGPPDQGQPGSGKRVLVALGGIDKQRDPRIESNIAAVLRKIGQQQQRACIEIGGKKDQRA